MPSSTASEPELPKKTVSAKVSRTNFSPISCWPGMVKMFEQCQNFRPCSMSASTSAGWLWPRQVTAMPLAKSRNRRPSVL